MSSSPTSAGACDGGLSSSCENCDARVVVDGNPMLQIPERRGIRNAFRQHRLVDQSLGAAIAQHIGDLRLLLAGRQQHRHQPGMVAANIVSANSIRLPSRIATRSPLLQAEFLKSRRDLRGLLHDLAPVHAPVAANQRLAVRISRRGLRDHRPDAVRPLAKGRHDAVAEARLEPHRRNGMLRPVHRHSLSACSFLVFMS